MSILYYSRREGKMETSIYVLRDPRNGGVKYVGKTINVLLRKKAHNSGRGKWRVGGWIGCLKKLGLRPVMEVIEVINGDGWALRERYWINHYQGQGCDLCNLSNGREGVVGRK